MLNLGINLIDFKKNYRGGLNTYTLELIEELEKRDIKLSIFTNNDSEIFLKKKFKKSKIFTYKKNRLPFLFLQFFCITFNFENLFCFIENFYYKDIKKKIEKKCDIFYCPLSYLKPYNLKIPTVSSPHDFQHLHFPKNFSWFRLKYRNIAFNLTVKKSSLIQASSNFIKNDIKKKFKINKNKIIVINEGVSDKFTNKPLNFKKNNYIFFPSQLWKHKDHITVLKSLKSIYKNYKINFRLIMVGEKFNTDKCILNYIRNNKKLNIHYLGKVSFLKLINLYNNCRLVISPSTYESSSLPILESCKIGRPVICSDIKPNLELNKRLKLNIFKTKNVNSLSKILLRIWFNKKLLKSQINFNKRKINEFNWLKVSLKYEKIFNTLNRKNVNI